MNRKFLAALMLLAAAFAAHADGMGRDEVRETIEASMLVTGTIHVDPDGRVERFEIDQRQKLPDFVDDLLVRAIPQWEFEPTLHEGKPAHVETSMRVRVAANKMAGEEIVVRIAGASFGDWGKADDRRISANAPPRYPRQALLNGVSGTVYLLGRVGLDGTMQEVVAEQVNLRYLASGNVMDDLREDFARASIRAAMKWAFHTPEDVIASGDSHWSVRIPVDFTISGKRSPGYGEWESYVPGPQQSAWWAEDEASNSADSYASGGIYPVGQGLNLLTPLEGNG